MGIESRSLHSLRLTTLQEALSYTQVFDEAAATLLERLGWTEDRLHELEHGLLVYLICGAQDELTDIGRHRETQDEFVEWFESWVRMQEAHKKAPALATTGAGGLEA